MKAPISDKVLDKMLKSGGYELKTIGNIISS